LPLGRCVVMGWIVLIVFTMLARIKSENQTCKLIGQTGFMEFSKEGDLMIGGIVSMASTRKLFDNGYQELPTYYCKKELKFARTMIFTVEEINRDAVLLPGLTLGYRLFNGCGTENLIHKRMGGCLRVTVSHLSTCACLSDRRHFPTFFRTVPSDRFQISGLVQLLKYFDWRWVGVIYSIGTYSEEGTAEFVQGAKKEGICVEYILPFSRKSDKTVIAIVEALRTSTSKVVLLYASLFYTKLLLPKLEAYNITGKQWVGTEAWITQGDLASAERKSILQGAMGLALPKTSIPGLGEYLLSLKPSDEPHSAIIKAFWEKFFDCSFSPSNTSVLCTGAEDLTTVSSDYTDVAYFREENNVYKSVYSVAYALHSLLQCQNGSNPTTGNFFLLYMIVALSVVNSFTDAPDCFLCPPEFWPNEERNRCLPKPTEFLSYKEIMGALLTAVSIIGVFLSLLISTVFWTHKETPIVRANNSELSFLLLFSVKLCFLCSLTFIGRPTEWSCMLRHTAFGITFVLCISCVLGKTVLVLMAFRATLPGTNIMKWVGPVQLRLGVLCFTLIQVLICILWLTINPPFPNKNMKHYKDRIILECALGSPIGFWSVLGYIGLLAILCFVLAFLARKLPDTFNEAKLITFSMLIFCAVWITFIPAYVSSPGKFTVAVEIFAILASSFGLLVCIFIPKCYVIIFHPQQNSKKHLALKVPQKAAI
uniref:G-protein coupled receptors family 3 profile domain-containing protein n=1 Tax=Salarias fasciatus TaxID=181472 RepID=A0A672GWI4_SALFA